MEWKEEFKVMMEACKKRDSEGGRITNQINELEFMIDFQDKSFIQIIGNPHTKWIMVNANGAVIVHHSLKIVNQMLTTLPH